MAVIRPFNERAVDAFMKGEGYVFPESAEGISDWKVCAWCSLPILPDQAEWLWQFGGDTGIVRMHTDCAQDWFPRAMRDFAKIAKQGDAE